jgi:inositol polyphosphate-4-phosphatase
MLAVFEGGLSQHLAAYSEGERDAWLQAIQLASYDCMRSQLLLLQHRVEVHRGQDPDMDIHMWRIRRGHTVGRSGRAIFNINQLCTDIISFFI